MKAESLQQFVNEATIVKKDGKSILLQKVRDEQTGPRKKSYEIKISNEDLQRIKEMGPYSRITFKDDDGYEIEIKRSHDTFNIRRRKPNGNEPFVINDELIKSAIKETSFYKILRS